MLRLVSTISELRFIVGTLVRSIPSMIHVRTLMRVIFYIYAITGYQLWRVWREFLNKTECIVRLGIRVGIFGRKETQRLGGEPSRCVTTRNYCRMACVQAIVGLTLVG